MIKYIFNQIISGSYSQEVMGGLFFKAQSLFVRRIGT